MHSALSTDCSPLFTHTATQRESGEAHSIHRGTVEAIATNHRRAAEGGTALPTRAAAIANGTSARIGQCEDGVQSTGKGAATIEGRPRCHAPVRGTGSYEISVIGFGSKMCYI